MVVTNSEAKYYNRLYKFFQHTEIKSSLEIDYDIRKIYVDSLEKENISSKYRLELISEYSYAAEPPVQFRLSHLSRRSEPL